MPSRPPRRTLLLTRLSALLARHPNWVFWLGFAVLNALLFLPLAVLDQESSTLLPPLAWWQPEVWQGDPWLVFNRLLIWRANLDPFRLSIELTLLAALWVWVRWLQRGWMRVAITLAYALLLSYYIYEAIVVSIYRADPVFYSHYFLARDGLPFLFEHMGASPWLVAGAVLGLLLAVGAIVAVVQAMLSGGANPRLHRASKLVVGGLAVAGVAALLVYQVYTGRPEMVLSSLGFKLEQNITASLALAQDVAAYDDRQVRAAYNYSGYQLRQRPDIYLIFVESYGSVLYKRPDYRIAYTALLKEVEERLHNAGWQATTALSTSPTWGGGSWLAYTSTLFGLRIDNQPAYLALRNKYQVEDYPDLGSALQEQGYYYGWVSSLDENLGEREWEKYRRFLNPDRWLRHGDLNFHGPQYGWGPAPPDQYVLNYANELFQQGTGQPLFFVTITQNSHYPWDLPPTLVEDWRTLNDQPAGVTAVDPDTLAHDDKRARYLRAIDYELDMLADFIMRNGDENSLFILVGDHQPPQVSRRNDGFETPMHIISQDPALLAEFASYGFTPGLGVDSLEADLRHEGFFSLLMRVLVKYYGAGNGSGNGPGNEAGNIAAAAASAVPAADLPAYLPEGAVMKRPEQTVFNPGPDITANQP